MKRRYGIIIDLNRCTGCNACIIACKQENDLPPKLDAAPGSKGFSYIRVECIGPEGEYPNLSRYYLPTFCMHCANPPCVEVCPAEAISRSDDGIVLIDEYICTACEACLEACPYHAISMDMEREIARKCTLCLHRIERNRQPACVAACNAGAMLFGDMAEPQGDISRAFNKNQNDCFHLKPETKTGPSIYYLKYRKKD